MHPLNELHVFYLYLTNIHMNSLANYVLILSAGFEDPLLLTAAQGAYAGTPTPNAYKLMPWTYVPSIATAFPTPDYPVEYFQNGARKN